MFKKGLGQNVQYLYNEDCQYLLHVHFLLTRDILHVPIFIDMNKRPIHTAIAIDPKGICL